MFFKIMELNTQDVNDQEMMIFPINIKTNNEEALQLSEQRTQPRTSKYSSINESKDSIDSKITLISNNQKNNLKYLIKYKNVYIPKIYLIDYNNTSIYPPKDNKNNNELSTHNFNTFKFPFPFFNFQNNNIDNEYLNYGYNFNQWKEYANSIKNKLDELNDLVLKGKIKLPEPDNELEYLMALPSDFGGLGNIYNDHKYENVKFYDPNLPENKNKPFIKQVKFERNMIWFPLKPNPESLTKNNPYNPFQALTIFLKQNNNNTVKENKDIINNENNNNNEKLKDKDDNNKKDKNIKNDKENIKSNNENIAENRKNKKINLEKHDRSESGKRIRERSRSISNSEFSDEEKVERYDNKNKKYNHYRYKKYNNYKGYLNNYKRKYSRFKKYDNYKYY